METVKPQLTITIPESIQGNKAAEKLYKEAFDSVFKFIQNTGELTDKNTGDISIKANSHAQAIFMAKMGLEGVDQNKVKATGTELYQKLGLGTDDTREATEKLQAEFQGSADKIETYKAFIEGFDAELVGRFSKVKDQDISLALLQVVSGLLENIETENPETPHSLLEMMERKGKISDAIFDTVAEVSILMKINPSANADSLLGASLTTALEAREVSSLTTKERDSLLETLKTKLNTKEKAEETQNKLQEFIEKNGKWLMMLFPMVAAPLAKAFSYLPVIGGPLNALLGQVSSNAGTLLTVLASSALTGEKQAPPARRDPAAAPQTAQSV